MKAEKQVELVSKVNNWTDFYKTILKIGSVEGSRGIIYTPEENIDRVVRYKKDDFAEENIITRGAGLRQKAIELRNI